MSSLVLLTPFLSYAVNFLGDFLRDRFKERQELKDEMDHLRIFLKVAHTALSETESEFSLLDDDTEFLRWASNLIEIVSQAEDAMDTFDYKNNLIHSGHDVMTFSYIASPEGVQDISNLEDELLHKIKSINKQINNISKQSDLFNIVKPKCKKVRESRYKYICHVRQSDSRRIGKCIYGFTKEKTQITELLNSTDTGRLVISVVGMGGSGKTALAECLFSAEKTKKSFDIYAWVSVVRTSSDNEEQRDNFIKNILKEFNIQGDSEKKVKEHLYEKKYMIFLDDVWDEETWEMVENFFQDDNNGSRLLITTRSRYVARSASITEKNIIELNNLDDQDSRQLLLEKVPTFHNVSQELQKKCTVLLESCCGLPLAILELGKLLRARKENQWCDLMKEGDDGSDTVKGIRWELNGMGRLCLEILGLSYNDLAPDWKRCFLYFSVFPKGYGIDAKKLHRLWAAEDFIVPENKTHVKTYGTYCMNQLIQRNMVQWGVPIHHENTVIIHGMLLELCILKAKQADFLYIVDGGDYRDKHKMVRRIALHKDMSSKDYLDKDNAINLRTLLCFVTCDFDLKKFKLLRVLDISSERMDELLDDVGNLVQLRYLGIHGYVISNGNQSSSMGLNEECSFWQKLQMAHLPCLHTLKFEEISGAGHMIFSEDCFSNLEALILNSLEKFHCLTIETGAMNNLKFLQLRTCDELRWLSIENDALPNLKFLDIFDCHSLEIPQNLKNRNDLNIKRPATPATIESDQLTCSSKRPGGDPDFNERIKQPKVLDANTEGSSKCHGADPDSHGRIKQIQVVDANTEGLSKCHGADPDSNGRIKQLQVVDANTEATDIMEVDEEMLEMPTI